MSENTEHTKNESHDNGKIIGALLVGAVLGAGIGYLFSSEEGKEMRKKIVDEVKGFAGNMKEKLHEHHCPGCNCEKEGKTA